MVFSSVRTSFYSRSISFFLIITFITSTVIIPKASFAGVIGLPEPGTMMELSPAYAPLMLAGLTIHPENPLLMDFIVSTGDTGMSAPDVKKESGRLIKYFLACLTIPENNQWVNLSPYEKQRIVPEDLGQTVLGRDMLAQDYILKQLTASLIYPERNLGKNFWDQIYAKAAQIYGTTQVPVNTFNKVWILPDTAKVFEHNNTVFVVKSHLKVMLDQDYLSLNKHTSVIASEAKQSFNKIATSPSAPRNDMVNTLGNTIIRQIILPAIEKEVNTGKNFAQMRQIYNSMILAVWFKNNLKQALLNQVYSDRSKLSGIVIPNSLDVIPAKAGIRKNFKNDVDHMNPDDIYQRYIEAYKKGVFSYIKEESVRGAEGGTANSAKMIPRKYFSGGLAPVNAAMISRATVAEAMGALVSVGRFLKISGLTKGSPLLGQAEPQDDYSKTRQSLAAIDLLLAQLSSTGRRDQINRGIFQTYGEGKRERKGILLWEDNLGLNLKKLTGILAALDNNIVRAISTAFVIEYGYERGVIKKIFLRFSDSRMNQNDDNLFRLSQIIYDELIHLKKIDLEHLKQIKKPSIPADSKSFYDLEELNGNKVSWVSDLGNGSIVIFFENGARIKFSASFASDSIELKLRLQGLKKLGKGAILDLSGRSKLRNLELGDNVRVLIHTVPGVALIVEDMVVPTGHYEADIKQAGRYKIVRSGGGFILKGRSNAATGEDKAMTTDRLKQEIVAKGLVIGLKSSLHGKEDKLDELIKFLGNDSSEYIPAFREILIDGTRPIAPYREVVINLILKKPDLYEIFVDLFIAKLSPQSGERNLVVRDLLVQVLVKMGEENPSLRFKMKPLYGVLNDFNNNYLDGAFKRWAIDPEDLDVQGLKVKFFLVGLFENRHMNWKKVDAFVIVHSGILVRNFDILMEILQDQTPENQIYRQVSAQVIVNLQQVLDLRFKDSDKKDVAINLLIRRIQKFSTGINGFEIQNYLLVLAKIAQRNSRLRSAILEGYKNRDKTIVNPLADDIFKSIEASVRTGGEDKAMSSMKIRERLAAIRILQAYLNPNDEGLSKDAFIEYDSEILEKRVKGITLWEDIGDLDLPEFSGVLEEILYRLKAENNFSFVIDIIRDGGSFVKKVNIGFRNPEQFNQKDLIALAQKLESDLDALYNKFIVQLQFKFKTEGAPEFNAWQQEVFEIRGIKVIWGEDLGNGFNLVFLDNGTIIKYSSSFASTPSELKVKLQGLRKVAPNSFLSLNGKNIQIRDLDLDGTLIINSNPETIVVVEHSVIRNRGNGPARYDIKQGQGNSNVFMIQDNQFIQDNGRPAKSLEIAMNQMIQPHKDKIQALVDAYHAAKKAGNGDELKRIAAEINKIVDQINVLKGSNPDDLIVSQPGIFARIFSLVFLKAKFAKYISPRGWVLQKLSRWGVGLQSQDIQNLSDFLKKPDIGQDRRRARLFYLSGKYVPQFIFAGAASRLNRGPMYGLDIWEIAEEAGKAQPGEAKSRIGMGPRQIIAYRRALEALAREEGRDPLEVISNQKMIININAEIEKTVLNDFIANGFYGFNPENVFFITQPIFHGYELANGQTNFEPESPTLPFGHGDNFMQLARERQAFHLVLDGKRFYLNEDVLSQFDDDVLIGSHRINDLTKFSQESVISVDKLAFAIFKINAGYDVVGELVKNPGKQKGGNVLTNMRTGQSFLIETSNVNGDPRLIQLLNEAGDLNAPYNAFRLVYGVGSLKRILQQPLPYNLRFKDGYFYLEAVTGDVTQMQNTSSAFMASGEVIHDFKEPKNLDDALTFLRQSDDQITSDDERISSIVRAWGRRMVQDMQSVVGLSQEQAVELPNNPFAKVGFDGTANRMGWTLPNLIQILENPQMLDQTIKDALMMLGRPVIISGMGGSGLSTQVINSTFAQDNTLGRQPISLRSTDPTVIKEILEGLARQYNVTLKQLLNILVIPIISKSGTTAETESHLKYFAKLYEAEGVDPTGHFILYTDPGSPMDWTKHIGKGLTGKDLERQKLLEKLKPEVRFIQLNEKSDIGGRFTAPTTNVFLLPLALQLGDSSQVKERILKILELAKQMNSQPAVQDQFVHLAAFLIYMAHFKNRDKVTFIVPKEFKDLPMWSEQLFEESLGKDGRGVTIIFGEDLNARKLKSVDENDRVFLRINLGNQQTQNDFIRQLKRDGYPIFDINVNSIDQIGGLMLGLERTVAFMGYLWGIVFTNQPGVEGYKKSTRDVMAGIEPGQKVQIPAKWEAGRTSYGNVLDLYYQPIFEAGQQRQQLADDLKAWKVSGQVLSKDLQARVQAIASIGREETAALTVDTIDDIIAKIESGIITEKDIDAELSQMKANRTNAPAVYAAFLRVAYAKGLMEIVETLSYGRMSPEFAAILQKSRSVYTDVFKIATKLGEGPDINHSYVQNNVQGRDMIFNTFIMPDVVAQPDPTKLGTTLSADDLAYDENLLRAPTIGTVQSLADVGRRTVLIKLHKGINALNEGDLKSIEAFFGEVSGYLHGVNLSDVVKDETILKWKSKHGLTLSQALDKIIKEYDIRGFDGYDDMNFPAQMDEELLRWLGRAIGMVKFYSSAHGREVQLKPGDTFVIGGDNGPSTDELLKKYIIEGLRDVGINVIDLGVTNSGHTYKSIKEFGAQGGLYVTRSHVEVGTNGAKPIIGGITLYGEMLAAIKPQILSAEYRRSERGKLITEDATQANEIRARAKNAYSYSLKRDYSGLRAVLSQMGLRVAVNLNSGSMAADSDYQTIIREILGDENIKTFLKSEPDAWARKGLADPSRADAKALGHPDANIVEYSRNHPDIPVFNFDLDADRVSILWNGQLFLGDEMFYPVIQYQSTMAPYADILRDEVGFAFDSRSKFEIFELARYFKAKAGLHPKGHSKVKATMDVTLKEIAAKRGMTVEGFLAAHPGFRMAQPEYSLHLFLSNAKGESLDDALDFMFFWLHAWSKVVQKEGKPKLTLAQYIQGLKDNKIISDAKQVPEQRIPINEDAKFKSMLLMKDAVIDFFAGNNDFEYIDDYRKSAQKSKPYVLVNNDGVFHLYTPYGEAFWGWSNTSPKVAIGVQSSTEEGKKRLAEIIAAMYIHARNRVGEDLNLSLSKIDPLEAKVLYQLIGVVTPDELEGRILEKYPTMAEAVSAIVDAAMRADKASIVPVGGIDLNSRNLKLADEGQKININFDPAMIAQFKRGDFSGVTVQILGVTPINLMSLLGFDAR